jgi:hypothetical protein
MNRKMATYLRFGPVVALLAIVGVALLAVVLLALQPGGRASASHTDATATTTTVAVVPDSAGDLAEYTFTFGVTVTADLPADIGEIRIVWDKDTQVPASIPASAVLIRANLVTNKSGSDDHTVGNQVRPLTTDPSFDVSLPDPDKKVVTILKVPDMVPGDTTASGGLGAQGIAKGANVTVTYTTAAGIKNATEKETSSFSVSACASACTITSGTTASNLVNNDPATDAAIKSKISVSAVDGSRGTVVTVTGQGFNDKTTATVWLDDPGGTSDNVLETGEVKLAEVVVGSDDRFTATFTVTSPPFKAGKKNTIAAIDGEGRKADGTLPTFELKGSISLSPTSGRPGDTITAQLKDFDKDCDVKLTTACTSDYTAATSFTLGGYPFVSADKTKFGGTTKTDTNGDATFTMVIPSDTLVGTGAQTLRIGNACCVGGGGAASTRSVILTVGAATLTATPSTVVPNQRVTLIGSAFTESGTINVNNGTTRTDASDVLIGNTSVNVKRIKDEDLAGVKIDAGGSWSVSINLPVNSSTTTAGTQVLKIIDSGKREGGVSLTIPARTLTVSPATGQVGTSVTIFGANFPGKNDKVTTPNITVTYDAGTGKTASTSVTPDAGGAWSVSLLIPNNAAIPSTNTIKAEFTDDDGVKVLTTVIHEVPAAGISLSKSSGVPGTDVSVTGKGFKRFAPLTSVKIGTSDVTPTPKPTALENGSITLSFKVPGLDLGAQTVVVDVDGTTASAPFTITAEPVAPPAPPPVVTVAPATALAPLGANLVRVWGFNAATQKFQLYDPAAALLSDLSALNRGGGYWINVKAAQTVTLGTGSYSLSAGWNLVGWLG